MVQRHQFCLNITNSIQAMANPIYLSVMFSLMVCSSVAGCMMVIHFNNDTNFAIMMAFVYVMTFEFTFGVCILSQKLYDCNYNIFISCYDCGWYRLAPKMRKNLQLMMSISMEPSGIKCGPSLPFNFETYGNIVRLSASYLTALISILTLE
ncbi:uncharacterized protein LOC106648316 [Trichogramma pretiosum]|uniref:uncharacterized protein LOC106648316 n=1 Tax=Trichogramma pretiosum TaxID=7493 RepID=UPI0006C9B481|nr:uncharacterized protein LOC106648316 [Trichogramma pretiosum]XP_014220573.1 uncharacterized protein LOC106648316 [Trichogramma pretiosum]